MPRQKNTNLDFYAEVGNVFAIFRRDLGMTFDDVAAQDPRLGKSSLWGIERGTQQISLWQFVRLCEIYGVAPEAILNRLPKTHAHITLSHKGKITSLSDL
jgi:hypothetical protein